jgi:hypothetical protein
MSTTLFEITEGWTQELGPFGLKIDGVLQDLSGCTVTMVGTDASRNNKTFGGTIRLASDQGGVGKGLVYYTPVAADFVAGKYPYAVHFKVVSSSNVVFFPNAEAYEVAVWPVGAQRAL